MSIKYLVTDALEALADQPAQSARLIHLDDAWARPERNGAFGVEYPTHPVDEDTAAAVEDDPGVTTEFTGTDILEACATVLQPGGLLVIDTDAFLLPRVLDWLSENWGPQSYLLAQVTALTTDGDVDKSTPGMYLSSGGYTVILAWRDATPLPKDHPVGHTQHTLHCPCERQRESYGWGTVKPLAPYRQWVASYTDAGDRIIVPCAGTAPTAIAAEREHGDDADVLCIDIEKEAKAAYERRRDDELSYQTSLFDLPG